MVSTSYEKLKKSKERGPILHTYSFGPFTRLSEEAWNIAERNGWHRESDTFDTYVAGLASEVGELVNAHRDHGRNRVVITDVIGYDTVTGEPILQKPGKPVGVGSELADIVIRATHLARFLGINLDFEVEEKMRYNESRQYKREYDN